MPFDQKIREEFHETKKEVISETFTLINSAFALVAALAWNEAIKALIDSYFPSGSGLYSRFTYALVVTLILVLVTGRLSRIAKKYEIQEKDKNKYLELVKKSKKK